MPLSRSNVCVENRTKSDSKAHHPEGVHHVWKQAIVREMASRRSKAGVKMNVHKAEASDPVDEYVTPGGYELDKILNRGCVAYTHVNEVWPNVYIGDE